MPDRNQSYLVSVGACAMGRLADDGDSDTLVYSAHHPMYTQYDRRRDSHRSVFRRVIALSQALVQFCEKLNNFVYSLVSFRPHWQNANGLNPAMDDWRGSGISLNKFGGFGYRVLIREDQ